jgi:transportin-3
MHDPTDLNPLHGSSFIGYKIEMSPTSSPLEDNLPPHSSDPTEELSRVILALETVFSARGSTASASSLADRYLVSFQRQAIAWVVCDTMLATPHFQRSSSAVAMTDLTPECHFFAAQTLHSKCRNYYAVKGQLPADSLAALRDSLMQHLFLQHVASPGGPVHTQLAMAISALSIQMGWRDVIPFLLTQVKSQDNTLKDTEGHRQAKIRMVCDMLRFLPEECNSDRLLLERDDEERHWFHNHALLSCDDDAQGATNTTTTMQEQTHAEESKDQSTSRPTPRQAKNAQHVLEFLWYLVQSCSSYTQPQQGKIIHKVLECLHSWIYHVPLPAELLQQSPLLPWVVSLLQQDDSSSSHIVDSERMELAVDVIVEVLRCFPSDLYWNKSLVQTLYPLLLSLGVVMNPQTSMDTTPFQMALKRQDEDELRAFTRIFTEMGESYLSLVVGPEECQQNALVELILTCSTIPDSGKIPKDIMNYHFLVSYSCWILTTLSFTSNRYFKHYTQLLVSIRCQLRRTGTV